MKWADYSAGRPPAVALKAAGFGGVIRYVGLGAASKRITATEYAALTAAGLQVLLVAEQSTGDAWGGYNAGLANAQTALNDARALGIPDSVGIAAAADAHATNQAQIDAAVAYCRGFRDVLGQARTGFYGFPETLAAVRAAWVASWFWRCGTPPTVADREWTHFWQRNYGTTIVSGIAVDINEQLNPLPEGIAMDWTDKIGTRKDGSPITAGEALANLYLGAYYGGGDAGAQPVYRAVNALATQQAEMQANIVAAIGPAVTTALGNAQVTVNADPQAIADAVTAKVGAIVAEVLARLNTATSQQ